MLLDPPVLGPQGEHPYVVLRPVPKSDRFRFVQNLFIDVPGSGTLRPLPRPVLTKPREYLYRQVVPSIPSTHILPADNVSAEYRDYLLEGPIPSQMARFTLDILSGLDELREIKLELNARGHLPPDQHATVARALESYLANSGDYSYTLNLQRVDRSIDPSMDFLLNVKKGHCERYAGSLALMLRSLGVPTRVVKGYRGADYHGDGVYYIRQSQAHAWVEAMVPDEDDAKRMTWLVLEPTPALEAEEASLSFLDWLSIRWRDTRVMWRNFILEYDTDRQQAALSDLWRKLTHRNRIELWSNLGRGGALAVVLIGSYWVGRRVYVRRKTRLATLTPRSPVAFYARFLEILRKHGGIAPKPEQTPFEFSHSAEAFLQQKSTPGDVAGQVVALLYRVRFGAEAPGELELKQLDDRLDHLARDLESSKHSPRFPRRHA